MKEGLEVDGLDALLVAARRLREVDQDAFHRILALCRTFVAAYDRPDESDDVFASRLMEIGSRISRFKA